VSRKAGEAGRPRPHAHTPVRPFATNARGGLVMISTFGDREIVHQFLDDTLFQCPVGLGDDFYMTMRRSGNTCSVNRFNARWGLVMISTFVAQILAIDPYADIMFQCPWGLGGFRRSEARVRA